MPDANEATTGLRDAIDAPAPDDAEMTDAVTEIPEGGRRARVDPKLSRKLSARFHLQLDRQLELTREPEGNFQTCPFKGKATFRNAWCNEMLSPLRYILRSIIR